MSLNFEGPGMSPEYRRKVEALHKKLTPRSLSIGWVYMSVNYPGAIMRRAQTSWRVGNDGRIFSRKSASNVGVNS